MSKKLYEKLQNFRFEEAEGNLMFGLTIAVVEKINRINREYEKNRINVEEYIRLRKSMKESIEEFKNKIEEM